MNTDRQDKHTTFTAKRSAGDINCYVNDPNNKQQKVVDTSNVMLDVIEIYRKTRGVPGKRGYYGGTQL